MHSHDHKVTFYVPIGSLSSYVCSDASRDRFQIVAHGVISSSSLEGKNILKFVRDLEQIPTLTKMDRRLSEAREEAMHPEYCRDTFGNVWKPLSASRSMRAVLPQQTAPVITWQHSKPLSFGCPRTMTLSQPCDHNPRSVHLRRLPRVCTRCPARRKAAKSRRTVGLLTSSALARSPTVGAAP